MLRLLVTPSNKGEASVVSDMTNDSSQFCKFNEVISKQLIIFGAFCVFVLYILGSLFLYEGKP